MGNFYRWYFAIMYYLTSSTILGPSYNMWYFFSSLKWKCTCSSLYAIVCQNLKFQTVSGWKHYLFRIRCGVLVGFRFMKIWSSIIDHKSFIERNCIIEKSYLTSDYEIFTEWMGNLMKLLNGKLDKKLHHITGTNGIKSSLLPLILLLLLFL